MLVSIISTNNNFIDISNSDCISKFDSLSMFVKLISVNIVMKKKRIMLKKDQIERKMQI